MHHLVKCKSIGGKKELSFAKNISAGGLLFYVRKEIAPGSLVELDINVLSYSHPIKAVAKVTRVKTMKKTNGFNIAVEFINIDDADRDFINKKIANVFKRQKK